MRILVTGATGFVGGNVVEQLLQAGLSVRALTRNPAKAGFPAEVEVIRGDLTDSDQDWSALSKVWPDVEEVLGRPPRTYLDWARDHVADFR